MNSEDAAYIQKKAAKIVSQDCSGGCMANSYKFNHSINDTYEVSCEMERKRVECAIMIKAALADADAQ